MNPRMIARMVWDFCRLRAARYFSPQEVVALGEVLVSLVETRTKVPRSGTGIDWSALGAASGIPEIRLAGAASILRPVLDMLIREVPALPPQVPHKKAKPPRAKRPSRRRRRASQIGPTFDPIEMATPTGVGTGRRHRGKYPKPVVAMPVALCDSWDEPSSFAEALRLHMARHGESFWSLSRAIIRPKEVFDRTTIKHWLSGARAPRTVASFRVLRRIERRYRLPEGYFAAKLAHRTRALVGHKLSGIGASERRRLAWHLPEDFDTRPVTEREEILQWVRTVVVSGATDYRRYQALAMKSRYGIRFSAVTKARQRAADREDVEEPVDGDLLSASITAPPILAAEMAELIRFKSSVLAPSGFQRVGVWGEDTASQKAEHLGLLFGALAASPRGAIGGMGVPIVDLTMALLVFPAVWDWYLQWRERRRGFFTVWEIDMLRVALAFTRAETGWLRQMPQLRDRLKPIPGLVTPDMIEAVQADWDRACDVLRAHVATRVKEIDRVARVHRDPFEPILVVLESDSPVGEYRKIADEIANTMPDARRYPTAAAEACRALLMIRIGLHTGLRQKNLRQLLFCKRGDKPSTEARLIEVRRGELRWSERENGWEILIPSIAFKNSTSSYFGSKPYRLILPDLAGLYGFISGYLDRFRRVLLHRASDPGTFFVKTVKVTSAKAEYDQTTFYEAWRLTIQRYGIYNPYTNRGAIRGLLPHGPHNIRDVLATHILKKTGSFERASYAIQDTPDMVAKHYGRFLPQDKAALAAQILNEAWI